MSTDTIAIVLSVLVGAVDARNAAAEGRTDSLQSRLPTSTREWCSGQFIVLCLVLWSACCNL